MPFDSVSRLRIIWFVAFATLQTATEAHPLTTDCIIDVKKDLGEPQPLLLDPQTDEFLFPSSSNGRIEFAHGEAIKLYCTDGFRAAFTGKKSIIAVCDSGKRFKVDDNAVDFSNLVCIDSPTHSVRRTNTTCSNGAIVEIGYQTDQKWLSLMRVCHNETIASTNWVQYRQTPSNSGYQHTMKQVRFVQGDFYNGLKVDDLYSQNVQRDTCLTILQSKPICTCLMPNKTDLFLSRGHLAARSDFIFSTHQRASFYFLNAAPQWQVFNGGNWALLEDRLKTYVDKRNLNVDIYTGTHGIVQFKDRHGVSRDMYLSSKTSVEKIPVPKIYYKIVVTDNNAGIVFIGVNNPHATEEEIKRDYIFCENVIPNVKYIPSKNNPMLGFMYACAIDDFAKFVKNLPNLPKIDRILL